MKKFIKIQYVLLIAFAVAIAILLCSIFAFRVDDRAISNSKPNVLQQDWEVVFADGSHRELSIPNTITADKNETIRLEHKLTSEMAGQTLAFHTSNQTVVVSIGEDVVYTFAQSDTRIFGQSPGSLWHYIPIPTQITDEILKIELCSPYKNLGGTISEILWGPRSACILYFIQEQWIGLVAGFALFLFGMLFALFYFAMGHLKLKNTGLFFLGLSSMLLAVNMIISTGLLQIFYGNVNIYYYANYMSLHLCLIPFLLFLSDTIFEKKKRQVEACGSLFLVLFFVASVLQIANQVDFFYFTEIIWGAIIVALFFLLYLIIRLWINKENDGSHILMILLIGMEISCIVSDYLSDNYNKVSYGQYGMMIILLILGSTNISKFVRLYRVEVDKQMEENIAHTNELLKEHDSLLEKIDGLQEKKQRADDMNASKSIFLANVAKEMIDPMNSILGMSELILRDKVNDNVKEKSSAIQTSGNTILTIINNIMDYSKFETGQMELKYVSYHLENMLYDMSELVSVGLIEKNVEFIVDFAPYIPRELYGDEIRIRQILANILTNAVKYTTDGVIRFRVDSSISNADEVLLKFIISDTGIGIKEEHKPILFKSFLQLDTSAGNELEGTGLGLAVCKRLLDMMGGSIKVESTYGEGTVFIIELPQKIINGMPLVEISKRKLKTLIFETNQLQRMLLKKTCMDLSIEADFVTMKDELKSKLLTDTYRTLLICQTAYEKYRNYLEEEVSISIRKVVLVDVANSILAYEHADMLQRPIQCMKLYDAVSGNDIMEPIAFDSIENFIAPQANILVVDDNPANLKIVTGMMESYKMQLSTAISGTECLKLLDQGSRYDIIFMDYSMPDLSGVETLSQIREKKEKYYKTLPIVAMASNKMNGAVELFLNEGFDHYIEKPIEMVKLEKILEQFLPEEKMIRNEIESA